MQNSNANTDAWADGFRFRLELTGINLCRLTPEFARTKIAATTRRRELIAAGIRARIFPITEDGGLLAA